jgi:hypothetical protein
VPFFFAHLAMTIETRMLVEMRDIRSVEFECQKCKARMSIPLTQDNHPPFKCKNGHCVQTFFSDSSLEWNELRNALGLLGKYAKADNLSFAIRLELVALPLKEATK